MPNYLNEVVAFFALGSTSPRVTVGDKPFYATKETQCASLLLVLTAAILVGVQVIWFHNEEMITVQTTVEARPEFSDNRNDALDTIKFSLKDASGHLVMRENVQRSWFGALCDLWKEKYYFSNCRSNCSFHGGTEPSTASVAEFWASKNATFCTWESHWYRMVTSFFSFTQPDEFCTETEMYIEFHVTRPTQNSKGSVTYKYEHVSRVVRGQVNEYKITLHEVHITKWSKWLPFKRKDFVEKKYDLESFETSNNPHLFQNQCGVSFFLELSDTFSEVDVRPQTILALIASAGGTCSFILTLGVFLAIYNQHKLKKNEGTVDLAEIMEAVEFMRATKLESKTTQRQGESYSSDQPGSSIEGDLPSIPPIKSQITDLESICTENERLFIP